MSAAPLLLAALALSQLRGGPAAEIEIPVERAYREAKMSPPRADAALEAAARALAEKALSQGVKAATDAEVVAQAVSDAGAWDPPPRVFAVRASPPRGAIVAVAARTDLTAMPATHHGAGFASKESSGVAVELIVDRRAALEPFPRFVPVGGSGVLKGELVFPLYDARLFVAGPGGVVRKPEPMATAARNRFAARVEFPAPGRYTVEVMAESIKGPEVAAIFRVQAGEAKEPPAPQLAEVPERDDPAKAAAQVVAAINARRASAGAPPLARSSLLDALAGEHSAEMARLGYFAHVSPVAGDATERAVKAGFRYRRLAENIGEAGSALEAQRAIESSPGHMANVLDREVDLVGVGLARVRRGAIENVLLTVIFARAEP